MQKMIIEATSETATKQLGEAIGRQLKGGEVFELVGDVGAGKTTFVKGLAKGLAVEDEVQSPSFTISRVYTGRDELQLVHYDFYRLSDAGIMANEVSEMVNDPKTITVVEWASIVEGVLPEGHYTISLSSPTETTRTIELADNLGINI
ncbi:MAG: tRNA (adenosine(37)-N6)-threonylcarbamoyltransferase complex ATPase subunit type 1 TsaE [Candidatus Saccharimonadaceae bacterium]